MNEKHFISIKTIHFDLKNKQTNKQTIFKVNCILNKKITKKKTIFINNNTTWNNQILITLTLLSHEWPNILTISIHNLEKGLQKLIKWLQKRKCFDLLTNFPNQFFQEMHGNQSGEFACGYLGGKGWIKFFFSLAMTTESTTIGLLTSRSAN